MIPEVHLQFWIDNSLNVLLRGKAGVGKTASILDAFKKNNIEYIYLSASTIDPWVDLIGVPKEAESPDGSKYLDFVRPKLLADDKVQAIFLDEFNRSPKKVRNAVMELIQFKSINGKKFNNLKMVWAAINPEDDEDQKYDVEPLDPAQLDRFHVIYDVPYTPYAPYFRKKYGEENADVAITWWKELSANDKNSVSPRRLDYAIDVYTKGGEIKHVLPKNVNINKLLFELQSGSISKKLKEFINSNNLNEAKEYLTNENNYSVCIPYILKKKEYIKVFFDLLPEEKQSALICSEGVISEFVCDNYNKFESLVEQIYKSGTNKLKGNLFNLAKQTERRKQQEKRQKELGEKNTNINSNVGFEKFISQDIDDLLYANVYKRRQYWDDIINNINLFDVNNKHHVCNLLEICSIFIFNSQRATLSNLLKIRDLYMSTYDAYVKLGRPELRMSKSLLNAHVSFFIRTKRMDKYSYPGIENVSFR